MSNANVRLVRCPRCRKILQEPSEVMVYECGGCGTKLQAKKRRNDIVDTTSQRPEDDSSGKQIMKQISNDHEASSSSNNQQLVINSIDDEQNRNSDQYDLPSSNKDQDAVKKKENDTFNNQEVCSSSNQQLPVNLIVGTNRNIECNDPRSSTELSGNEDPESSPEATAYNRIIRKEKENVTVDFDHSSEKQKMKQVSDEHETGNTLDQQLLVKLTNEPDENNDQDNDEDNEQEFKSCRNMDLNSSSFSELEDSLRGAISNRKINRDSNVGSKSSFKSLIAEKLLDTRQKKVMYLEEDDILSEDGTADLNHRRRFDRISSENVRFNGASNYYGYEGSVSSFDENEDKFTRKNRFNRRTEFHPLNKPQLNPRYHSATIHENPKLERIELLKMVRELQDQLEKTSVSKSAQQVPAYYDHGLNYPGRYGHRMAFSGETTAVNRRRESSTCHRCGPQDRHFSAQIPRQHVCFNGPHYGPNDYYNPRYSGLSSPTEVTVMKPYSSPKKKRYVRPIAGGSPWITCYWCSELLELPQSFLVFKKRYHSLKCGACFKVLNFTLSNGTHVGRYYPEETFVAPPSSEVEDYDKSTGSRADPVSCTDRSFQRDYSTETDRYGSREFSNERLKATMSRDPSSSTRPSSSNISGRRNTTSEIEEVKRGTNASPLHWLMGYASPSKVIRG